MRFWLYPSGSLSRRHYRFFLLIYFLFILPALTFFFLAFIVIGVRGADGMLKTEPDAKVFLMTTIYVLFCLWPFFVASLKRLHDLGLKGKKSFFHFNPIDNYRLARRMLLERGNSAEED